MNAQFVFSRNRVPLVVLTVSRQPGNNFRVAASCDPNALARLTVTNNVPDTIYVPGSDAAVSGFPGHITPLLTVWRRLHVELDSMAAVTGNFISGAITNVGGGTTSATILYVNQNLADGSPMLPTGNGRFENGVVAVGAGGGATNLVVEANGASSIRNLVTGLFIPFRITKPGRPDVTGNLRLLEPGTVSTKLTLNVTDGNLTGAYKDGTINVAGVTATILGVNPGQSLVTVALGYTLPFVVHDDDVDNLLPSMPNVSGVAVALADAYVQPVYTTPAVSSYNGTNGFVFVNVSDTFTLSVAIAAGWGSRSSASTDFWLAYVSTAFQGPTILTNGMGMGVVGDNDPDGEAPAVRVGATRATAGGSLIFLEGLRESTETEARTVVHELGHAVGANTNHYPATTDGVIDSTGRYLPEYLDSIRTSTKPSSP